MDNNNFEEYEVSLEEFTTEATQDFLNYTNRVDVPHEAMYLIKKIALKRYLAVQNLIASAKDGNLNIKSYSQGDVSITYKDTLTNQFELSDDERKEMDRFIITKATRRIQMRKKDEDYFD